MTTTGGHLGSNLGAVELTLALHRVFDSPRDVILWDTGHQAYVHKLLTGRRYGFKTLKQAGGLSGYPNRAESEHDWIENSHASTGLSYAHGLASGRLRGDGRRAQGRRGGRRRRPDRGDGLRGPQQPRALRRRVVIVLNDNGRSYAPTVSQLSQSLTSLRLNPTYTAARERRASASATCLRRRAGLLGRALGDQRAARDGGAAHLLRGARRALRRTDRRPRHRADGAGLHPAAEWDGPIVVHVLTQKGHGYAPAEEDDIQRLHDVKATKPVTLENTVGSSAGGAVGGSAGSDGGGDRLAGLGAETEVDESPRRAATYTDAFSRALMPRPRGRPHRGAHRRHARPDRPAGLPGALPRPLLRRRHRRAARGQLGRRHGHGRAAARGGGVLDVLVCRAFDQANLDVGLHGCPVVFVLDRAGITGDDGPSHHGILDLALALSIPGMTVFAPSSAEEVEPMLRTALELPGPSTIRVPKTTPRHVDPDEVGRGLEARQLRPATGRCAYSGWARRSEPASTPPTSWPTRGSTPPSGTCG